MADDLENILDVYEQVAWAVFKEHDISFNDVLKALEGWSDPDPRFMPVDGQSNAHKPTWFAFDMLDCVHHTRQLLHQDKLTSAWLLEAGQRLAFAEVSLNYPEMIEKLNKMHRHRAGKPEGFVGETKNTILQIVSRKGWSIQTVTFNDLIAEMKDQEFMSDLFHDKSLKDVPLMDIQEVNEAEKKIYYLTRNGKKNDVSFKSLNEALRQFRKASFSRS